MSSLQNSNSNSNHATLPSGNKSKKSKTDLLRTACGMLLKQKKFVGSEKFRRSDFLLMQNKGNFSVQKMMEADLHSGNSFTYSNVQCITNNQHMVDQQFGRFKLFVESQPETMRVELKRFYAPMLCHLYLDLLKAREYKGAVDFLKKYVHLVAPVDLYDAPLPTKINGCSVSSDSHSGSMASFISGEAPSTLATNGANGATIRFAREAQDTGDIELDYFMKLVQILSCCTKLEIAENDATVSHFRASKYELHTTSTVMDTLSTFLEKRGHVLILSLIYNWIHVHIVDNEVQQLSEDHIFFNSTTDDSDGGACLGEQIGSDVIYNREQKPNVTELSKSLTSSTNSTTNKRQADIPTVKLEADVKAEPALDSEGRTNLNGLPNFDACLQTMRESRDQILKTQPEFPRFIEIPDKEQGLTSAHLDANECHLVAGFNTSVVQLWQLNQQNCGGKNLYRRVLNSQCPWELNNYQEEEEDEVGGFLQATHLNADRDDETAQLSANDRRRHKKAYASKYTGNSFNEFGGIQLRGHSQGVTDVRFSAHYSLIYSVSKDSTMRSWRAHNYNCAAIYRGHYYPIWCMDESPTGMYMVTGSRDFSARLWALERDHALIIYAGHTQDVECVAFHPNGNYIATGSADHSVRLWCVTSGKLVRVFSDCKQSVTSVVFSPDGKTLAAGGEESKVRIFDIAAGAQLSELKDHTASVTSLAWNTQGSHLATACIDGSLRVWDIKKLSPMQESTSSSSSSTTTTNRLLAVNSSCQRLIKVCYSRNRNLHCIGTT